jgi:segregation and condensation protein B
VSAIRGVNVDATITTLLQRGYVEELGRDPGPGNAFLYGTTPLFLERLGLHSLQDLPPLGDFVPAASVVEALERGLRLEPDIPDAGVDPDPDRDPDAPAGIDERPS